MNWASRRSFGRMDCRRWFGSRRRSGWRPPVSKPRRSLILRDKYSQSDGLPHRFAGSGERQRRGGSLGQQRQQTPPEQEAAQRRVRFDEDVAGAANPAGNQQLAGFEQTRQQQT